MDATAIRQHFDPAYRAASGLSPLFGNVHRASPDQQAKSPRRKKRGGRVRGYGGSACGTKERRTKDAPPPNGPGLEYQLLVEKIAKALGITLACGACTALKQHMNKLWAAEGRDGFTRERESLLKQLRENLQKAKIVWDADALEKVLAVFQQEGLLESLAAHDLDPVATLLDGSIERHEAKCKAQ